MAVRSIAPAFEALKAQAACESRQFSVTREAVGAMRPKYNNSHHHTLKTVYS
jgi:hypothetical protein